MYYASLSDSVSLYHTEISVTPSLSSWSSWPVLAMTPAIQCFAQCSFVFLGI